ncbi:MAG: DUF2460 domain-containing protein [Acidobacteriaceae bacterium]|nr:DUF2460 domain-containing protein [Acidobacteriaceae bacterium]MBV8573064.1 DUF2460 domain-containing protein [Acidobacteriaceae bacterium]
MPNFPTLSTGVVAQYPLAIKTGQGAHVVRFLDGADQRFLTQAKMLRSWRIQLDLLSEEEIRQLEAFFVEQAGDYSTFAFPDPYSGTTVPNCRFAAPGFVSEYLGIDSASTEFWVIETYG